jgi:hypothetical protein
MASHNDQLPAPLQPTALTTPTDADLHLVPALERESMAIIAELTAYVAAGGRRFFL